MSFSFLLLRVITYKKCFVKTLQKYNPLELYITAPPAFKVKHRKNRPTESRSPFSTDRKYDVPTGSGFHVKKSEKKLTEFKEFKHHEGEWKVSILGGLIH